jgi:hypothetical protein
MSERLACSPDGCFSVRPDHNISVLSQFFCTAFWGLLDRYFDTHLAYIQALGLKLGNQMPKDEEINYFAFSDVPRRTSEVGQKRFQCDTEYFLEGASWVWQVSKLLMR